MNVNGLPEIIDKFIKDYLRNVHTIKPARVISVDHSNNKLNAEILTDTYYSDETNVPQPDVYDVPFFILSAARGDAKITMPLAVNDLVLILFSDRDYESYLDTNGQKLVNCANTRTHSYTPILALPCFYTPTSSTPVSNSDIVVSNKTSSITIAPDGNIDINTTAQMNVVANGAVNITTPTATVNGDVVVTGDLTVSGSTALGSTVTSGGTDISGTHVHSGVTSGGANTGTPV